MRVWQTTSGPVDVYQVGQLRRRRSTSSGIAQCSALMRRAVGVQRASAGGHAHIVRSPPPFSVSPGPCQHCSFLALIECACACARARNSGLAGPLSSASPSPCLTAGLAPAAGLAAAPAGALWTGHWPGGCAPVASRLSASFRPCFKLSWLLHPRPAPLAGVPLGARRSQLPTRAFTLGVIVSRCHRLLGPAFSLLAVAYVSVFLFAPRCFQP